jgi:hypothetical protein
VTKVPGFCESFDGKPTVIDYEITKEDVIGPFVEKIPNDMVEMTKLNRLSYTSPGRARAGGGGSERSRGRLRLALEGLDAKAGE